MIARVNKTDFDREKKRLDKFFRSIHQGAFIAAKDSAVRIFVIPTDEELEIANQAFTLVNQ